MKTEIFFYKKLWARIVHVTILLFSVLFLSLWLYGKIINTPVSFILTDQNGKIYNSRESGTYKLIFFGYTHCPDICPVALSNMSRILEALGGQADIIQPIFITVDPERDTPPVIRDYIGNFDPRLIGLTGTPASLTALEGRFAVYSNKVKSPDYNDYLMDHSTYIYLMNKDDTVLDAFDYEMPPGTMAEKIRRHIK